MLSLEFWHFFFAFLVWNKVVYETVYILRIQLYILAFSFPGQKPLAGATTNLVQWNGMIFVWVELWELFLSR